MSQGDEKPKPPEDPSSGPDSQEVLPPNSEEPAASTLTVEAKFSQGPLPPAAELAKYNEVLPGAADRIITMAEGYARHQQKLEEFAMRREGNDRRRSQNVAGIVVLAIFLVCLIALFLDKDEFAIQVGTWTVVALASIFVLGKVPEWFKLIGR